MFRFYRRVAAAASMAPARRLRPATAGGRGRRRPPRTAVPDVAARLAALAPPRTCTAAAGGRTRGARPICWPAAVGPDRTTPSRWTCPTGGTCSERRTSPGSGCSRPHRRRAAAPLGSSSAVTWSRELEWLKCATQETHRYRKEGDRRCVRYGAVVFLFSCFLALDRYLISATK